MLPNLSLVMEFLGNVFTNSIFEKLLSHEALLTGRDAATITIQRSFSSSYKWKNCLSDIGSFDSFLRKYFAKVISCFKSFSRNEYDSRILSTVLREMFDFPDKELKYTKELLLNYYRKSVENSIKMQNMWVELKLQSRNTYIKCFEVVCTRQQNAIQKPGQFRIN